MDKGINSDTAKNVLKEMLVYEKNESTRKVLQYCTSLFIKKKRKQKKKRIDSFAPLFRHR